MENPRILRLVRGLISENLSEMADSSAKIWNTFQLPAKIDVNGYAISSKFNKDNVLNAIISISKHKWKTQETIVVDEDEDGSGYMFKYIITLIKKEVKENPSILDSSREFTKTIAKYFNETIQINQEPLTRAEAEELKRKVSSKDLNSFKRKGASIVGMNEPIGKTGKKLIKTKTLRDVVKELDETDNIQFYPEDNIIFYTQEAFQKLIKSIPQSFVSEFNDINNDKQNDKDPETGKKIPYKLKNIPNTSRIFRTIKDLLL
jgi:hypothetical protein